MECGVSPVSALSQNRAKCKNLTKVYAATNANDDTGKVMHHVLFLLVAGETKTVNKT